MAAQYPVPAVRDAAERMLGMTAFEVTRSPRHVRSGNEQRPAILAADQEGRGRKTAGRLAWFNLLSCCRCTVPVPGTGAGPCGGHEGRGTPIRASCSKRLPCRQVRRAACRWSCPVDDAGAAMTGPPAG